MARIEQMENGRRVLVIKFQLAASKKKKKDPCIRVETEHCVWFGTYGMVW